MKVSIIVPVYNTEKFLDKCIQSLLNQTIDEKEIIVVDDGSCDNSYNIAKKYEPKIQLIHQENQGLSAARNKGLQYASGEYVGFVDSDDYVDIDMYERMYNQAKELDSDLVISNTMDEYPTHNVYHRVYQVANKYNQTPSACNKLFRRSMISEFPIGLWYEDFYFTTKFLSQTDKISYIDEYFYHAYCRETSIMTNHNSLKNMDITVVMSMLLEYLDEDTIDFLMIHHIVIGAINRVNVHKSKEKNQVLHSLIDYVKHKRPNLLKSKSYVNLARNRRIIAFLNYHRMFKLSKLLLAIKAKLK